MARAIRAIIMGAPGAGKGTISSRLVDTFQLVHLSSGDLLRGHIDKQTSVGIEAKQFIDQGLLVPDQTILQVVLKELEQHHHYWMVFHAPSPRPPPCFLMSLHMLLSTSMSHLIPS